MKKIEWKRVTWYSQAIAIVLFVGVFFLGYYIGKSCGTEEGMYMSQALR